jgi:hypothetical protein
MESKKNSFIELPVGEQWVQLRKLAYMVSLAIAEEKEDSTPDCLDTLFDAAFWQGKVEDELIELVAADKLKVLHPKTRGAHRRPFDYALHETLVPINELRDKVLKPRAIELRFTTTAKATASGDEGMLPSSTKEYGLRTLNVLCQQAGGVKKAFEWHELKEDGLWLSEVESDGPALTAWKMLTPHQQADVHWHPHQDHHQPALPVPFGAFDFAAFVLEGQGFSFLSENYDDDDPDLPCESALEKLGTNAGVEKQLLKDAYALRAQARERFDLRRRDATADEFAEAAKWLLSLNSAAKSANIAVGNFTSQVGPAVRTWQFHTRLQTLNPWRGGLMTDTDVLTLNEAAEFATAHAGRTVTVDAFLRAAGNGQISLRAVCQSDVRMMPCCSWDKPFAIFKGARVRLPRDACRSLVAQGSACWRTYDGCESHPDAPEITVSFVRWQLADGAPDIVTTLGDCRVMGLDVHALADASAVAAGGPEPSGLNPPDLRAPQISSSLDEVLVLVGATESKKKSKPAWRDSWGYIVEHLRQGQFATAVELNHSLHKAASGEGSPFEQGEGQHRGKLWVKQARVPLALKTIQNHWSQLRAEAASD